MRKKVKKPKLKRFERQERNVKKRIIELMKSTEGIKGKHRDSYGTLLESESDHYICTEHCIFNGHSEICKWYRENKCAGKCKGRVESYQNLGVDSRKIKYSPTEEEKQLKKKISNYMGTAEKINDEITKIEKEDEKKRKKKEAEELAAFLLNEPDEPIEEKPKGKYSNLDRLI